MKKILAPIITDTHLQDDNLHVVRLIFLHVVDFCKKNKLKHFFHLGDHFNKRDSQKLDTLLFYDELKEILKNENIIMVTIPGNHDKTDLTAPKSYVDIFKSDNIRIFKGEKYEYFDFSDNYRFYLLPYFKKEIYDEKIALIQKNIDSSKKNVLLTHIGVEGALNNNGDDEPHVIKTGIFQKFDKVLIGHFHNKQKLNSKVMYIGSTDPRNYGEDDEKGLTILYDDLSTSQEKFPFVKSYRKIVLQEFSQLEVETLIKKEFKTGKENLRIELIGEEEKFIHIDKKKLEESGVEIVIINRSVKEINEDEEVVLKSVGMEKSDKIKHFKNYCKDNKLNTEILLNGLKLIK